MLNLTQKKENRSKKKMLANMEIVQINEQCNIRKNNGKLKK